MPYTLTTTLRPDPARRAPPGGAGCPLTPRRPLPLPVPDPPPAARRSPSPCAGGFLGTAVLATAAAEAGVPVRAILREGSSLPGGERAGVQARAIGLDEPDALAEGFRGCRAVVHAAASMSADDAGAPRADGGSPRGGWWRRRSPWASAASCW